MVTRRIVMVWHSLNDGDSCCAFIRSRANLPIQPHRIFDGLTATQIDRLAWVIDAFYLREKGRVRPMLCIGCLGYFYEDWKQV